MKGLYKICFVVNFCIWGNFTLFAQVVNDDCFNPIILNDVTEWCSKVGEFTIVNATASTYGPPACFTSVSNDVWFQFTAVATDIVITISGNTQSSPGGTLEAPEAALYEGFCGGVIGELECQTNASGSGIIELYQSGLFIGNTYLIRIDGRGVRIGTFEICMNNYNPPAEPTSDCPQASLLCDKSSFVVKSVEGAGNDIKEIDDATCFFGGAGVNFEMNSTWFVWRCDTPGPLTLTLTPNKVDDDLDFVIYELPNGIGNCDGKILLRCMASGDNNFPSTCMGPTGLRNGETDISEPAGCKLPSQSNFLAPLDMELGKYYAFVVNNFTSTNTGFAISFGGAGTFEGPKVDFFWDPDTVKCLEVLTFVNQSTDGFGNLIQYDWAFGQDAVPNVKSGNGPHDVIYNSWGEKFATLTVTNDLGCKVTKTKPLYIDICCLPGDNFQVGLDSLVDITCNGDSTGEIYFSGTGGTPWYKYSLDGIKFNAATSAINLLAGEYEIVAFDSHGCRDSFLIEIEEPQPLTVNAGEDKTVILGDRTNLNASFFPFDVDPTILWTSIKDTSILCDTCWSISVRPPGQTTYIASIVDENGCRASDEVTVFVNVQRPIYYPNAISPNGDGNNEKFTLYGNSAARQINYLRVYNRWGGLMFEGSNFLLNDPKLGWDGTVAGRELDPAVFVFVAEVNFIDGVNQLYKGEINLLK